jgi:5'-deoxy-5'-methylthioadenosine phosphorylase
MYAVIGGSGLTKLSEFEVVRREVMRTPYGEPSGVLTVGRLAGHDLVFMARHGYGHTIAPHDINYCANIWALKQMGVEGIVGVASVGGIRADLYTGALVVPDGIIDYTHGRRGTFFEGPDQPVVHIDFTHPYTPSLRKALLAAGDSVGEEVFDGATYGCTQGPRLETAAEVRRLERDGCDIVGMTGMPEAVLARELGIPYAALAVVVNPAAGKGDSSTAVSMDDIQKTLAVSMVKVCKILSAFVALEVD